MKTIVLALVALLSLSVTAVFAQDRDIMGMKPLQFDAGSIPYDQHPSGRPELLKILLGREDTGGQFTLLMDVFEEATTEMLVTPHKHDWHDETFYVVRGKFEITNGDLDKKYIVKEDHVVFTPRGAWHSWRALEPNSKVLMFYNPGGFENLWDVLLDLTPEQMKDKDFMRELVSRYDTIPAPNGAVDHSE